MCSVICNPLCLCKIPTQPASGSTLVVSPLMRAITFLLSRTTAVVCLVPNLISSSSHLTGTSLKISPSFTSILSLNNPSALRIRTPVTNLSFLIFRRQAAATKSSPAKKAKG